MLLWRGNIKEEIKYQTEGTICAQFEVKVSFVCLGDSEKASVTENHETEDEFVTLHR